MKDLRILKTLLWFGAALALAACSGANRDGERALADKDEEKKEEAIPVEAMAVARGRIEAVIQASTNLETEAQVQVFARTTNLLDELLVEEGDSVKQGQVLARLEDETQKIQVAKARAQLDKAKKDYKRQEDLYGKELITQQAFNDAAFELKQAELNLADAEQELKYTEIRAPISGTVTQRMVNLGDQINVNQRMFDLVDFESMVARVYLPEGNLARLGLGQKARILSQALGSTPFEGFVERIAPTVDAKTGTVKVTVKVAEIGRLRPGMFVNVELVLDVHEDAPLIPKRALVYDSDQLYVFRVKADNRVERLLLQPVLMDKDNVEPDDSIQVGDRIVVAGQTGLKDDALVRVLNQDESEEGEPADETPAETPKAEPAEVADAGKAGQ